MEELGAGHLSLQQQQQRVADILRLLSLYTNMLDSYIIEFFTDNLWEKVPRCWRQTLSALSGPQLATLLLGHDPSVGQDSVWPLSLLAFRAAARSLALPRLPHPDRRLDAGAGTGAGDEGPGAGGRSQSSRLDRLHRRHVKPKKQHEIRILAALVKRLCEETGCEQVVDVGSGQGHLCRFLAFTHGLRVTGVEAAAPLVEAARRFDTEFLLALGRESARAAGAVDPGLSLLLPRHLVCRVDPAAADEDFVRLLEAEMRPGPDERGRGPDERGPGPDERGRGPDELAPGPEECGCGPTELAPGPDELTPGPDELAPGPDESGRGPDGLAPGPDDGAPGPGEALPFVLTALHACGDLGPATLRRFAGCPAARGLATVSCCYMKGSQTAGGPDRSGYPMSEWVRRLPSHRLPYKLRETACHAVEDFAARLRTDSHQLRTHVYRAALEVLIRRRDPRLKRPPLQNGNKVHLLPFPEYASACLRRLGLEAAGAGAGDGDGAEVAAMLGRERQVIAYTCLCLTLAPAIESLILLDRALYLREQGLQCRLLPLFDPRVSPRNFVLVAAKGRGRLGNLLVPSRGSVES